MMFTNTSIIVNYTGDGLQPRKCYFLDVNLQKATFVYAVGIITIILNTCFSVTAVFGNTLIIYSISKTPSLQTPSNILLGCLAFSDLFNGLLVQPLHVVYKTAEFKGNFDIFCNARVVMEAIGWVTSAVSVETLCVISVEKYLALYFHLRYIEIVTTNRLFIIIGIFWVFFAILSASRFLSDNTSVFTLIVLSMLFLSLLITFWAYFKIYGVVRRHQKQIHDQELATANSPDSLNMPRYKKSTKTMVYVLGLFLLCYGPFLCVQISYKLIGYSSVMKVCLQFTGTVAFMNATFNPIVYCMRITALRRECWKILRRGRNNQVIVVTTMATFTDS